MTIAEKFKFEIDSIPDSVLTWATGNEGGKARKDGAFLVGTATLTGLPASNAGFGKKTARLMIEGLPSDSKQFEIFYLKAATNHPGGQANSPNWYHYWLDTPANRTNTTVEYGPPGGFDRSEYLFKDSTIIIRNDAAEKSINAWGAPMGIDAFAWTTAHEAKHHTQMSGFWPHGRILANDGDNDFIPADVEPSYMIGRPYNPLLKQTYNDDIGYNNGRGGKINDQEDIAMRAQTAAPDGSYPVDPLWINGNANAHDWANPGKNSKNSH